jgi:pyruvate ferredoxin oxidoreductase alpha subunit
VDRFLPPFDPGEIRFRAGAPASQGVAVLGGGSYSYFRYEAHLAARAALGVYDEIAEEFARAFGRRCDAVEAYRMEGAEIAFVMIGSFATKAKDAVDRLREAGWPVGLVRPRLLRPLPGDALRRALAGVKGVAVVDQNLSVGMGGVLHAELAAALYDAGRGAAEAASGAGPAAPVLVSFIGGLGGRDITAEELFEMAAVTRAAARDGRPPPPRLLYTQGELDAVRKLQAIAHAKEAP